MAQKRIAPPQANADRFSDLEFTHYLATVPVVSVDEGMRGVLLLTGDATRWPTFTERQDELIRRGAVRCEWHLQPDDVLAKGTLAYMLRAMCKMPPDINELTFAKLGLGDRRYALHTLIHEGVMPPGRESQPVLGGELLTALSSAQAYIDAAEKGPTEAAKSPP